jgi:hypothetical protein
MRIPSQNWAKATERFLELERRDAAFGTMRRLCEHVERAPYRDLVYCALSMHTLLVSQHPELEWNCGMLRVELMGSTGQVSFTFCEQPFAEPASWRCDAAEVVATFDGFLRKNKWVSETVVPREPSTISEVTRAERFSPAVAGFVCRAREFCVFVEKADTLAVIDRMLSARQHLLELYTAAVALPSIEPPDGTKSPGSPDPPQNWSGFDAFETYWEIFDPYDLQEAVAGSLSDDLLDVYRDLRRGLALWDCHHDAGAVWEWKFHFDAHWGDHAVDALRALHRACRRGGASR